MLHALPGIDPVAIAIDELEPGSDVRLSGIDLETGGRVSIVISRTPAGEPRPYLPAGGRLQLVVMLTVYALEARQ